VERPTTFIFALLLEIDKDFFVRKEELDILRAFIVPRIDGKMRNTAIL